MDEKKLVMDYVKTYDALNEANDAYDKAKDAHDIAKTALIESLEARSATATAKYDGYGRVSLQKPELYASVKKENEDALFSYLRGVHRDDLIKPSVHWKSLSSFAGEMTNLGKPLPEFITVSYKKVARLTK